MRSILHPGEAAAQRVEAVPVTVTPHPLQLQPGRTLLAALGEALAPLGAHSAVLTLHGGQLQPFAYVMPALAKTPAHAVYFSDRHAAEGPVQLDVATVTYGQRNTPHGRRPWLHCHARWTDAQGHRHCGHVLPEEAVLSTPVAASAWLLTGAGFEVQADEETRFSLFKPVVTAPRQTPPDATARPALAVRLGPNIDVCHALEALCRERGIRHAQVRGGVGSTVGAVFDDGRRVEPFVTETLVRHGRVRPGADGELRAELDVSLVDYTGGQAEGRLARGLNPVLVTFELVLEVLVEQDAPGQA